MILMVDWHNMMYRTLYIAYKNMLIDDDYGAWKHLMTTTLLSTVNKFSPNKVIVAIDSNSWRKKHFPEYKAHRKDARKASLINYDEFYKVNDNFIEQLKDTFPCFCWMRVKDAECDDIVAVLTKEAKDEVTIFSSDKDFIQLLKFKNVKVFSPHADNYLESINPEKDLELKIIMGDSGDNIPAILPKTGPVKASKLLTEGILYDDKQPEEVKSNIRRNRLLISFEEIPEDVKTGILNIFNETVLSKFNNMKFLEFCIKNGLKKVRDEIGSFSGAIKNLTTE